MKFFTSLTLTLVFIFSIFTFSTQGVEKGTGWNKDIIVEVVQSKFRRTDVNCRDVMKYFTIKANLDSNIEVQNYTLNPEEPLVVAGHTKWKEAEHRQDKTVYYYNQT